MRILKLKEEQGILNTKSNVGDLKERIAKALQVVGSQQHHNIELNIARQAITLLKDEVGLPVQSKNKKCD